jgi:hypothetical protein
MGKHGLAAQRTFVAVAAGGLSILLAFSCLIGMLYGSGRVYIDFNSIGEGWLEVALFYIVGVFGLFRAYKEIKA